MPVKSSWFRQDWMRYVILGIAGGMVFIVMFAGVFVEVIISEMRKQVAGVIYGVW